MSENMSDGFDWSDVTGGTGARGGSQIEPASGERAAASSNLPPFPQGGAYMVGRLPLSECMPGKAIVQLPEAIDGVHCATVVANTGVLSDCYTDSSNEPSPQVRNARPINDREIVVYFAKGEGVAKGLGWTPGDYQGSQPTTRNIGTGVPYVEVVLFIGPACGCSSDDWYTDPYQ